MTPQEIRLECLRLAHSTHLPPVAVLERALEYVGFVAEIEAQPKDIKKPKVVPSKKTTPPGTV